MVSLGYIAIFNLYTQITVFKEFCIDTMFIVYIEREKANHA